MRNDVYQTVTNKIILDLEKGIAPWVRPWRTASGQTKTTGFQMPKNATTRKNYSGINILMLWSAMDCSDYRASHWLTFKQALALGGNVRKGEHGTTVYYADKFTPKKAAEKAAQDGSTAASVYFMKQYTVFNVEQCEGLPAEIMPAATAPDTRPQVVIERELVPAAEALIKATGADFRNGGDAAYYVPAADFIQMPHQTSYFEQINYYRTAFHEIGHWTGHTTRLDRNLKTSFGTQDYAREELVAEMTAAFVCASIGIVPTVRHADYIGNWMQVLKEDNKAIFRAASAASKAADFILAFQAEQATIPTPEPIQAELELAA